MPKLTDGNFVIVSRLNDVRGIWDLFWSLENSTWCDLHSATRFQSNAHATMILRMFDNEIYNKTLSDNILVEEIDFGIIQIVHR